MICLARYVRLAVLLSFALVLGDIACTPLCGLAQQSQPAPDQVIRLDPKGPGRTFDGVGAISSSSSLLLYDYPEPQRGEILDYLFKPNFGASLDIFKFEIGGDMNSTTSTEPSHMRTPDDLDCHRGIEWWMAKEAKARNPQIKIYALMWGAPGWFKNGSLWGADHVRYLVSWLGCAKENGLHVDYLGGGNERGDPPPPVSFYVALHKAIAKDYPEIKIVASDEHAPPNYWHIATEMLANPEGPAAISILGEHDVCHWRSLYQHCDASADARASGKPLWNNEQSTQDAIAGAEPLARAMNRNYIEASLTANINWAIVAGYYGNTATGGQGLVLAETPWSGAFQVSKSVWVDAHTTQFVRPGWRYLDLASTYLTNGGSFVTLYSPATGDYSVVIETADAATEERVRFTPAKGLSTATPSLWVTDLSSSDTADWFVDKGPLAGGDGGTILLQPHHLYTISTVHGQHANAPAEAEAAGRQTVAGAERYLKLPFGEDFEHIGSLHRARFFQDQGGAFEAAPCKGGRAGTCYTQVIRTQPILWHGGGKVPSTIVGDPEWWGDYSVSTDAMLEEPGYVEVLGRIEEYSPNVLSGYHFRIADTGAWQLYSGDDVKRDNSLGFEAKSGQAKLAEGSGAPLDIGTWHKLSLAFHGDEITAALDGKELARVKDTSHSGGQAGLMIMPWKRAQFDNFAVERTAPWPHFVPRAHLTATATSSQAGVLQHRVYVPSEALDGRAESRWSSQWNPALPMPQSITLHLGGAFDVSGLAYEPPGDPGRGGRITRYTVEVSHDGKSFRQVAAGTWNAGIATKTARWKTEPAVKFVRLTALETAGAGAGASELNVICEHCAE